MRFLAIREQIIRLKFAAHKILPLQARLCIPNTSLTNTMTAFNTDDFDLRSTMSQVVQYVLVRGDLTRTLKWPSGAVIAQACHACVAAVHTYYSDPDTQAYLADLGNMHKVVLEVSRSSRCPPGRGRVFNGSSTSRDRRT